MSDNPPDADILAMQRLAAGDELALNEIMLRWQDKVVSFLHRTTGEPETAMDLALETFVRLYQHRASYAPDAAFPTFLFRIASNLSHNHHRWKRRHPIVSLDGSPPHVCEAMTREDSPDEHLDHVEQLRRVEDAIAALPADLRQAVLLFTYEDMSYRQIAEVLHCSAKAVETRIYRARQLLKSLLKTTEC